MQIGMAKRIWLEYRLDYKDTIKLFKRIFPYVISGLTLQLKSQELRRESSLSVVESLSTAPSINFWKICMIVFLTRQSKIRTSIWPCTTSQMINWKLFLFSWREDGVIRDFSDASSFKDIWINFLKIWRR
jgi:hypothetical protein